jgi:hypothetical protein
MPKTIEHPLHTRLLSAFTDHPKEVGEGYFEHMWFALRFAGTLGLAGGAALIHAIFPFACKKTASQIIFRLHDRLTNR